MNYMSIPIGKPVKFLLFTGDENPHSINCYSLSISNTCLNNCGLLRVIEKMSFDGLDTTLTLAYILTARY
jgi:hypothetical protein